MKMSAKTVNIIAFDKNGDSLWKHLRKARKGQYWKKVRASFKKYIAKNSH